MPGRRFDRVILLLAFLAAGALLLHFRHFYHDDAFITLRYVSRVLSGLGLTWNNGERIEGFTHPLWFGQTLLLGFTGMDLVVATRVLGVLYLITFLCFWWRARLHPLPLFLLVVQGGLVLWSLGGLETVSFCFWLCLALHLTFNTRALTAAVGGGPEHPGSSPSLPAGEKVLGRRAILTGAAWAAAGLTRPEGAGVALLALSLLTVGLGRRSRRFGSAAAAFVLPTLGYVLFRALYFHDLLSVSSRAKLEGIPLFQRADMARNYLVQHWALWIPLSVILLAILIGSRKREAWLCAALSLPLWLGVFLGGGDHMPGARLLLPPLAVLALAASRAGLPSGRRSARALVLLAAVVALAQFHTALAIPGDRDPAAKLGAVVGRFLQENLPPGSLVAASTAGSTTFMAPSIRFIDMLGLNDPVIARRRIDHLTTVWQRIPGHLKGDGAYVLSRAPDVVILGPSTGFLGENPKEWFLSDYELLCSPDFRARYDPYVLFPAVPEMERKDPFFRSLIGANDSEIVLIAYLRRDSPAVRQMASMGQPLYPPWERPLEPLGSISEEPGQADPR